MEYIISKSWSRVYSADDNSPCWLGIRTKPRVHFKFYSPVFAGMFHKQCTKFPTKCVSAPKGLLGLRLNSIGENADVIYKAVLTLITPERQTPKSCPVCALHTARRGPETPTAPLKGAGPASRHLRASPSTSDQMLSKGLSSDGHKRLYQGSVSHGDWNGPTAAADPPSRPQLARYRFRILSEH